MPWLLFDFQRARLLIYISTNTKNNTTIASRELLFFDFWYFKNAISAWRARRNWLWQNSPLKRTNDVPLRYFCCHLSPSLTTLALEASERERATLKCGSFRHQIGGYFRADAKGCVRLNKDWNRSKASFFLSIFLEQF